MKKVRILRFITRLNTGGPSWHVIFLEKGLQEKGYLSRLIAGVPDKDEGNMSQDARREGVKLDLIPDLKREINLKDDLIAFFKIWNLIRKYNPHIVHTHMSKAGFLARLAAILNGVPLIFHTFHGHVFSGYFSPWKTKLYIFLERFLARSTTKLITLSSHLKKELSEDYKISHLDKFSVVPLGFTFENLSLDETRDEVRKRWETPVDALILTIVARLVEIKNHSFLLRAFSKLQKEYKDQKFYLWIVGDGHLRDDLERGVAVLGISDKVKFLGWQKKLGNIYHASDLVVLTSRNEGLPVALIEAMAVGKKVVAPKVGGIPDLLEDEDMGLMYESENEADFIEKVKQLVSKKDFNLPDKLREYVRQKYSARRLVDDIDHLYQSELRKKVHFL